MHIYIMTDDGHQLNAGPRSLTQEEDNAVEQLTQKTQSEPHDEKAWFELGKYYFLLAKKYSGSNALQGGDSFLSKATVAFRKAFDTNGDLAGLAAHYYGYCYYMGGHGINQNFTTAEEYFQLAVDKLTDQPNKESLYANANYMLGLSYLKLDKKSLAQVCFVKAITYKCDKPEIQEEAKRMSDILSQPSEIGFITRMLNSFVPFNLLTQNRRQEEKGIELRPFI
jgi:tetratricopeptide (TPR) repeat protein